MACKRPLGDTLHYMPFLQSILGVGFFYQGRILEELFSNAKVRTVPDYKARFVINILAEYFRIFSNNKTSNITASWRSSLKKCYFAYQKRFYMIWDLLCLKKISAIYISAPCKTACQGAGTKRCTFKRPWCFHPWVSPRDSR